MYDSLEANRIPSLTKGLRYVQPSLNETCFSSQNKLAFQYWQHRYMNHTLNFNWKGPYIDFTNSSNVKSVMSQDLSSSVRSIYRHGLMEKLLEDPHLVNYNKLWTPESSLLFRQYNVDQLSALGTRKYWGPHLLMIGREKPYPLFQQMYINQFSTLEGRNYWAPYFDHPEYILQKRLRDFYPTPRFTHDRHRNEYRNCNEEQAIITIGGLEEQIFWIRSKIQVE